MLDCAESGRCGVSPQWGYWKTRPFGSASTSSAYQLRDLGRG